MQEYEVMYHKIIAKNLRRLRKKAKFSQEELAEKLDCSREFISRAENSRERLSLKMILKLSYLFNVLPEVFFREEEIE